MPCKNCEFEVFGWMMWDKTDSSGWDGRLFSYSKEKPTTTDEEQEVHGGDHQGHLWDSFPLYRRAGCISGCDENSEEETPEIIPGTMEALNKLSIRG